MLRDYLSLTKPTICLLVLITGAAALVWEGSLSHDPLAFILVFAVIQPLGPSGHIFVIAASLLWPPPVAVGFAMLGALSAQTTGFYFYRYLAADFARARIPARLHKYEKVLVEKPFRTVLVLRLLTFTAPFVTMLLGVSRVRYVPMMTATVIGIFPNLVFDVYIGGKVVEWLFGG